MKPRKPIRKISANQAKRLRLYRAIKSKWLVENPLCACCIPISNRMGYGQIYARWTDDVHHTRGKLGELLFLTGYWKASCRNCHNWIHAHPAIARELGLLCAIGQWNTMPK